jgi:predicted dehydrogenase
MTFNVILVGCGYIAQAEHIPGWMQQHGARIAAIVDQRTDLATAVAGRLGVAAYGTLTDASASVPADAVHICTPPISHEQLIKDAARLGLHILIEKPLALSSDAARRCVAAAASAGVTIMTAAPRMYDSDFALLGSKLREGEFGPIHALESLWGIALPPNFSALSAAPRTVQASYMDSQISRLAARLLEESIHHLGLISTWLNSELTVKSVQNSGPLWHVTLTSEQGTVVSHTNASPLVHREEIRVYGENAFGRSAPWSPHFPWQFGSTEIIAAKGGDRRIPAIARLNQYWAQIADFVRTAQGTEPARRDPAAAVRDIELIESIVAAANPDDMPRT